MHVVVTGRNIELTPALKDYLIEKLHRSQKHFEHPLDISALLSVAKNPSIAQSQTAEVTIKVNGSLIRGKESTENMYASIDLVANKIERQLSKFKTRHGSKAKGKNGHFNITTIDAGVGLDNNETMREELKRDEIRPKIYRAKQFQLKPMPPEEAVSHMDLLGHDFLMFINSDTDKVSTIYHRRDGNYGLIEPEL